MKTAKDWLLDLPDPYRSQALKNHEGYKGMGYAGSLSIAIILAFKWSSTAEGTAYWTEVNKMCLAGKFWDASSLSKVVTPRKISVFKSLKLGKEKKVKVDKPVRVLKNRKEVILVGGVAKIRYIRLEKREYVYRRRITIKKARKIVQVVSSAPEVLIRIEIKTKEQALKEIQFGKPFMVRECGSAEAAYNKIYNV